MSCGVGCRHGSDPARLWLWWRPAAVAPIRPLAWDAPDAAGTALKRQRENKERTSFFLPDLGAEYEDHTSQREKEDDKVLPGKSQTYVWQVLKENGPTASDPPCLTYSYLSHVDLVKDLNSGLIGALLVCREGAYEKGWGESLVAQWVKDLALSLQWQMGLRSSDGLFSRR